MPPKWGPFWGYPDKPNQGCPQMPLTDTAIRKAKPHAKAIRLFDGGGLYLEVSPSGGKLWRWKHRVQGVEKRLSLGMYPDVSLKLVRERHGEARRQLASGIDPVVPLERRNARARPVQSPLRPLPGNGMKSFPQVGWKAMRAEYLNALRWTFFHGWERSP